MPTLWVFGGRVPLLPHLCQLSVPEVGVLRSSGSHSDHQQKPVLIRDKKVKWLDFGSTPDPVNFFLTQTHKFIMQISKSIHIPPPPPM